MLFNYFAILLLVSIVDGFKWNNLHHNNHRLYLSTGYHGQDFHYLPILQGNDEEHFPRIIHIAGVYPKLAKSDIFLPQSVPSCLPGTWVYNFPDLNSPQLGIVAVPGSQIIASCVDPIALIAKNVDLRIPFPEEVECLVIIDRKNKKFAQDAFFLFEAPSGQLTIQWQANLPEGYQILGRVILVITPHVSSLETSISAFAEDSE